MKLYSNLTKCSVGTYLTYGIGKPTFATAILTKTEVFEVDSEDIGLIRIQPEAKIILFNNLRNWK